MRHSRLVLLALAAIPRASGFYFCVPLSSSGIRTSATTSSARSRRPLSVGPLALARKRGAAGPTMNAGEDFDQLDGVSCQTGSGWEGGELCFCLSCFVFSETLDVLAFSKPRVCGSRKPR